MNPQQQATSVPIAAAPAQPAVAAPVMAAVQVQPPSQSYSVEALRKDDLSVSKTVEAHNKTYCRRLETESYLKKQLRMP